MAKFVALLLLVGTGALGSVSPDISGPKAQKASSAAPRRETAVTASSPADEPGDSPFNYEEPRPGVIADARDDSSTVVSAVSADFDGDGVQDVVSVDELGQVRFVKGNAAALFPGTDREKNIASAAAATFLSEQTVARLGFSPDDLIVGDFNADGQRDVIAVKAGADALILLAGNGKGGFADAANLYVPGAITTVAAGEIGRSDGQTDVAVGYVAASKAYVAIFEHPEGAFTHRPEIFPLPAPANSIAIGEFDRDGYSDVAVSSGDKLTIVHGRGQAYPLDLLPAANIQRPAAAVSTIQLPFPVASMIAAEMTGTRGDGLAMLGEDGRVHYFKPSTRGGVAVRRLRSSLPLKAASFQPAGTEKSSFIQSVLKGPSSEGEADATGLLMANTDDLISKGRSEVMRDKAAKADAELKKLSPVDQASFTNAALERQAATGANRKRQIGRAHV